MSFVPTATAVLNQWVRILAALESNLDENDSERRAERVEIEDVLRTTENVIAEKDNEILELKRRVEEPAGRRPPAICRCGVPGADCAAATSGRAAR